MFSAVCTNCKKDIKVPFRPDPTRPVYCKDCFEKMKLKPPKVSLRDKKQRKSVDMEGLKKILEETLPKK